MYTAHKLRIVAAWDIVVVCVQIQTTKRTTDIKYRPATRKFTIYNKNSINEQLNTHMDMTLTHLKLLTQSKNPT